MTLLNLGCGPIRLPGFENLDLEDGWHFEDGLPYPDASVEGVSISHALMHVALKDWPFVFREIDRVLTHGGVVRITEDSTADPESERFGGWHDAVTLTTPELVAKHMRAVGLRTRRQTAETTGFRDGSLLQAWHGDAPKVFFVEGRKP